MEPEKIDWQWHGLKIPLDLCRWTVKKNDGWHHHYHDFYEVFWVEEGFLEHKLNGEVDLLVPGDILFISPGENHEAQCVKSDSATYTNLSLKADLLDEIKERYAIKDSEWPWGHTGSGAKRTLYPDQITTLKQMFDRVNCESMLDHDLFILQLLKFVQHYKATEIRKLPIKLQHAVHKMQVNKLYKDGIQTLVNESGYTREYIYRLIKKSFNKSPIDLINDFRLEEGKNKLLNTDLAVLDIAYELGFQSLSYFYKIFKKRYGVTPKELRKQRNLFFTESGETNHMRADHKDISLRK